MTGVPTICPSLRYADARAAVAQLKEAFGFTESALYADEAGIVMHAELSYGDGTVMLGTKREEGAGAAANAFDKAIAGAGPTAVYVVVEDVDTHCARARAAGAEILDEPSDPDYGGRHYLARDREGNLWSFGTYAPQAKAG